MKRLIPIAAESPLLYTVRIRSVLNLGEYKGPPCICGRAQRYPLQYIMDGLSVKMCEYTKLARWNNSVGFGKNNSTPGHLPTHVARSFFIEFIG